MASPTLIFRMYRAGYFPVLGGLKNIPKQYVAHLLKRYRRLETKLLERMVHVRIRQRDVTGLERHLVPDWAR
jgi:hypothetical protein